MCLLCTRAIRKVLRRASRMILFHIRYHCLLVIVFQKLKQVVIVHASLAISAYTIPPRGIAWLICVTYLSTNSLIQFLEWHIIHTILYKDAWHSFIGTFLYTATFYRKTISVWIWNDALNRWIDVALLFTVSTSLVTWRSVLKQVNGCSVFYIWRIVRYHFTCNPGLSKCSFYL